MSANQVESQEKKGMFSCSCLVIRRRAEILDLSGKQRAAELQMRLPPLPSWLSHLYFSLWTSGLTAMSMLLGAVRFLAFWTFYLKPFSRFSPSILRSCTTLTSIKLEDEAGAAELRALLNYPRHPLRSASLASFRTTAILNAGAILWVHVFLFFMFLDIHRLNASSIQAAFSSSRLFLCTYGNGMRAIERTCQSHEYLKSILDSFFGTIKAFIHMGPQF